MWCDDNNNDEVDDNDNDVDNNNNDENDEDDDNNDEDDDNNDDGNNSNIEMEILGLKGSDACWGECWRWWRWDLRRNIIDVLWRANLSQADGKLSLPILFYASVKDMNY